MIATLRPLIAALRFLTRVPGLPGGEESAADLARATVWFPLVGGFVGLGGAVVYVAAAWVWPPSVAAILAVAATAALTGAMHEDGLADTFDGLGGGWTAEQALRIMRDSRIGVYGTLALTLVTLLKVGALASMTPTDAGRALLAGHVLSRWTALPLMRHLPYARKGDGAARPFAETVTRARLITGTVLASLLLAGIWGARALAPALVAALVTLIAGLWFHRRLGGMTGDCLGAANQLVETGVYLTLAASWN